MTQEKDKLKKFRNKHFCKRCHASFNDEKSLEKHREDNHGEYSRAKHLQAKDSPDHRIYKKHFDEHKSTKKHTKGRRSKAKSVDKFNPVKVLKEYLSTCKVSEPIEEPNYADIPEENRIYSENKTCWCSKTTKEQADRFMKSLDELHERMKTRGTDNLVPAKEDMVMLGNMKHIQTGMDIQVYYIYDMDRRCYRTYTDATKLGELEEVVFDKDIFRLKRYVDTDKIKKKNNGANGIPVIKLREVSR